MALRVFVSGYTYRTEEAQGKTLAKAPQLVGAVVYTPADFSVMFRKTSRPDRHTYYAASVACFAPDEDKFKWLIGECRKARACLASIEEGFTWTPGQSTGGALKAWREARTKSAAKIGADISAKNRKDESKRAADAIAAEWRLPNKDFPTAALLLKAAKAIGKNKKMHYRTMVRHLGRRPIEQANYQAALKRKEARNAK